MSEQTRGEGVEFIHTEVDPKQTAVEIVARSQNIQREMVMEVAKADEEFFEHFSGFDRKGRASEKIGDTEKEMLVAKHGPGLKLLAELISKRGFVDPEMLRRVGSRLKIDESSRLLLIETLDPARAGEGRTKNDRVRQAGVYFLEQNEADAVKEVLQLTREQAHIVHEGIKEELSRNANSRLSQIIPWAQFDEVGYVILSVGDFYRRGNGGENQISWGWTS